MVALNSRSPDRTASQLEAEEDAALVRRFKAGDDASFTEIVARHRAKTFAIALARLHSHTDAEEVAQDTFIRAHRALANFRGESSLATWLYRITANLAHNRYWYFFRRGRQVTQSLDWAGGNGGEMSWADHLASDAPGPAHQAMTREFTQIAAGHMDELRPNQREILRLRNVLNHSYEEIAAKLGLNVGTVKSRIARARKNLYSLIASSYPEFAPDAAPAEWIGASPLSALP